MLFAVNIKSTNNVKVNTFMFLIFLFLYVIINSLNFIIIETFFANLLIKNKIFIYFNTN